VAFVARAETQLDVLDRRAELAEFTNGVDGSPEHEKALEEAKLNLSRARVALWKEAARYEGVQLPPDVARKVRLLRVPDAVPSPFDEKAAAELFSLQTVLTRNYTDAQDCVKRTDCRPKARLYDIIKQSRVPAELLSAWKEWHDAAAPVRTTFAKSVKLLDSGARDFRQPDAGAALRSQYEMPADAFAAEYERLWNQMRPLYEALHCHVRAQLHEHYGDLVPERGPIPAHLLGNMWGQYWEDADDLLGLPNAAAPINVTQILKEKKTTSVDMVRMSESFFRSLGFPQLPNTFWKESLFEAVKGRNIDCHESAWPIDPANSDVRLKMCVEIDEDNLRTLHHELGHVYYYLSYAKQPPLFRDGANPGFHEAIGDAVALSITPSYLKAIGLTNEAPSAESELRYLIRLALDKLPTLATAVVVDKWRWNVYSGKIPTDRYNAGWWDQVGKYQGLAAPMPRSERDFDAGMFYHISYGVPYDRYFIATLLQFDIHRALCRAAGYAGDLYHCSIYGSRAAGDRLQKALALGASVPWPEALEQLTGSRQIDGSAMLEYFAPVSAWLAKQNEGRQCGW